MNILIVGRGGREHAIAWKAAQSPLATKIFIAPGNAGMRTIERIPVELVSIDENDTEGLLKFAQENHIDLTIIGPEAALMNGIANRFQEAGLTIFAPTKEAARIEGSKQFAKELMAKYNIPTAAFATFEEYADAKAYLDKVGAPIVIKYDGLAAGKGVVVAMTVEEADNALKDMLLDNHFGKGKVVMEEFLQGPEFSLLTLVNGEQVVPLVIAQDHKRAYDGDKGPNTGGMGAYAPVPVIPQAQIDWAVEHIMKPTAKALQQEGCPFCGVLYGGLMLTHDGPKVIEFNARFGDPETEVVLPKMESDFIQHVLDLLAHKEVKPTFYENAFLGVVMAAKGYPGKYGKGFPIHNLENVEQLVFHMGTHCQDGHYISNGGRVLFVVGQGKNLQEAQADAYRGVKTIDCDELFYRNDIGWQAL
ncbi:MAG: phosphoribosylamine--glycine ligase [Bacteroidales bacterium]|nr:phosphoribosylamine--glycine ligase [Bacteroidales bacterium]